MQDSNNENTIPTPLNHDNDETVPTRVPPKHHDSVEPTDSREEIISSEKDGSGEKMNPGETDLSQPEADVTRPVSVVKEPSPLPSEVQNGNSVHATDSRTEPVTALSDAFEHKKKKQKGPRRWPWIILGIFLLLVLGGIGALGGYNSAVQMRQQAQESQKVSDAKEHFMLGLVAQSNKQYEIAKMQYEYVIRQDPSFPGVQDKLREVLIEMSMDRTPTPVPTVATPTLTPTPDLRPQEEIYAQAKAQYAAQDWEGLFATVDSLRQIDPLFHAVEIDGMLYMALRFRGIDKILHQANLEGGLYDLALAERFGPLDVDATGYRTWARQYLNGASFWEADWEKVMAYFEEIYPYFPNMRDSSGLTAIERYRIAARSQGDKLMEADDACGAYDFYQKSLKAVNDPEVERKSEEAYLECYPPTPTDEPTPEVTATETPQEVTPEPTDAVEPTSEPEVEPTSPPEEPVETPAVEGTPEAGG